MRNTKYFELDVFDEDIDVPEITTEETKNTYFDKSLTPNQEKLLNSNFLKRLNIAAQKWDSTCKKYNDELNEFFKKRKAKEFTQTEYNFQPFKAGKYWQMMEYLDGTHRLEGLTRESYQESLMMDCLFAGDLLQIGWDLAINSALLCDITPVHRDTGSIYLFENILADRDSLFYPSVTDEFHKRVVNEAFWQSLFDSAQDRHDNTLEKILTDNFANLDPSYAEDNILRWSSFHRFHFSDSNYKNLVSGTAGPESFHGLSPRAVKNYGKFINKIHMDHSTIRKELAPFVKSYIEAVNCTDYDGIEYFEKEERKKLLRLGCVEESNLQKTI